MRYLISICLLLMIIQPARAATYAALGYFDNTRNRTDYDYLSTVLPNSLASTLSAEFDLETWKPSEIDSILKRKELPPLKRKYNESEINALMDSISKVDFFITGSFQPLDDYNIEVVISIYDRETKEHFSFSTTGRFSPTGVMETEVFNMVDKLSDALNSFILKNQYFKNSDIPSGSKLAFITNLDSELNNSLYKVFLDEGYGIIAVQSNEIYNHLEGDVLLWKLKYIGVKKNVFNKTVSGDQMSFQYSPALGKRTYMYQQAVKGLIKKYYYSYPEQQETAIKNLNNAYGNKIDYLFIIIFDKSKKTAWMRCFDCKRFDAKLIWLNTGLNDITDPDEDGITEIAKTLSGQFRDNDKTKKQK